MDGDDEHFDPDGDGFYSYDDNCPNVYNGAQTDYDIDGIGYVCDDHIDFSGVSITEAQTLMNKNFTLFGIDGVSVNDRAEIKRGLKIYGERVEIGAGASVGTVWTGDRGLFARNHAHIIDGVYSSGIITYQDRDTVTFGYGPRNAFIKENMDLDVPDLSQFTVDKVNFPAATGPNITPEPGDLPVPISPNTQYNQVVVKGRTTLVLESVGCMVDQYCAKSVV